MRWEDESYVKLYRRRTAAQLCWPWQATALWPNLLTFAADTAGLIDTGRDEIRALSLLTLLPADVVEAGLAALLEDGCLERVRGGFLIRNYVAAQEARKTDARRKRDQRERDRDDRRAQARESPEPPVTHGHTPSHDVTRGHPSSPSPSPSPSPTPTPQSLAPAPARGTSATPPPLPPLGEDGSLRDQLEADFQQLTGKPYAWSNADDLAVGRLLGLPGASWSEIRRRWGVGLGTAFPRCRAVSDLAKLENWNAYATAGPSPPGRGSSARPTDIRRGTTRAEDFDGTHGPAGQHTDF